MDSITHAKTNSLNTTYRIKPISPFGYTDVLTNISVPFYQDNSFSKHNYLLNIHDKKLQIATKAFNLAKKETENLRSNLHFSYIAKKQLVAVYKRKKKKLAAIEQSAVKIQKHIRGYLTRKKYYDDLLILQEKIVKIRLNGLGKSNINYLYYLGKAPAAAANKIQKSVKKFLFRCKIHKFKSYYDRLLMVRAEKIFSVIKRNIACYASKLKIQDKKFLRYREKRLKEIRVKLSIIAISNIFKKLRLTFKSIKHKIGKYKRKLKSSYIYENTPTLIPISRNSSSGKLSVVSNHEVVVNVEIPENNSKVEEYSSSVSENERIQREIYIKKLKKDRKDRIKYGKISYSIRKVSNSPPLLPYLYQKDVIENFSTTSNYFNITRATASRISESQPQRHSPSLIKSKTPVPTIVFKSKRIIGKIIPIHEKETFSSKMNRKDTEPDPEAVKNTSKRQFRVDSKVLQQTFAYQQKRQKKYIKTVFEVPRPKTNFRPFKIYEKKVVSPRPYTMTSKNIVFSVNL